MLGSETERAREEWKVFCTFFNRFSVTSSTQLWCCRYGSQTYVSSLIRSSILIHTFILFCLRLLLYCFESITSLCLLSADIRISKSSMEPLRIEFESEKGTYNVNNPLTFILIYTLFISLSYTLNAHKYKHKHISLSLSHSHFYLISVLSNTLFFFYMIRLCSNWAMTWDKIN
jgi:hypothetical protein